MCHLPKIKVSVQQCFFHGDFLLSRIPPTSRVGVLEVVGPIHCRSGRYTSLWGIPPRLDDECTLTKSCEFVRSVKFRFGVCHFTAFLGHNVYSCIYVDIRDSSKRNNS